MGSQSDYPVMKDCEKILKILKLNIKFMIVSAHRTPKECLNLRKQLLKMVLE